VARIPSSLHSQKRSLRQSDGRRTALRPPSPLRLRIGKTETKNSAGEANGLDAFCSTYVITRRNWTKLAMNCLEPLLTQND
jgi:hypothetical protein